MPAHDEVLHRLAPDQGVGLDIVAADEAGDQQQISNREVIQQPHLGRVEAAKLGGVPPGEQEIGATRLPPVSSLASATRRASAILVSSSGVLHVHDIRSVQR